MAQHISKPVRVRAKFTQGKGKAETQVRDVDWTRAPTTGSGSVSALHFLKPTPPTYKPLSALCSFLYFVVMPIHMLKPTQNNELLTNTLCLPPSLC